jgi:hypothetical protein
MLKRAVLATIAPQVVVLGCVGADRPPMPAEAPSQSAPQSMQGNAVPSSRTGEAEAPRQESAAPSGPSDVPGPRDPQAELTAWCASDRVERRAAFNAQIVRQMEAMRVAAESAAVDQKREAAARESRIAYIKKNCRKIGVPSVRPQVCVDEAGYLHKCDAGLDLYLQCPDNGPPGLRGVIGGGGPATPGEPGRVARARTVDGPPVVVAPPAHELTKDERCADLDKAAK